MFDDTSAIVYEAFFALCLPACMPQYAVQPELSHCIPNGFSRFGLTLPLVMHQLLFHEHSLSCMLGCSILSS
jgi:hypothetical protein